MSVALWCDKGGHAFSDTDPGHKRMTYQEKFTPADQVTRLREVQQDLCGPCADGVMFNNPTPAPATRAELE